MVYNSEAGINKATAVHSKILKCLEGEKSVRCRWMLRTARKDDSVSEEMLNYLIVQCSNISLHMAHGYLTWLFTPLFRA